VRFLPLSLTTFVAAPLAGRLSAHVPIRLLLGFGLALCAVALWLMSGVTVDSSWTTLLPGFVLGGIGTGFVNAPLATTAVSTVRQERAGMASGLNNTFRQLGIATGIAALGAIFQTKIGGNTFGAGHLDTAGRAAFVSGLNAILEVAAVVAAAGAVLAVLLVRGRDFVASGPPPTANP
jgi:MFS family permease